MFTSRKYPRHTKLQVEAFHLKLRALKCMLNVQKREAEDTANVLLSLIERLKTEVSPPLPMKYSRFQALAHNVLGRISLNECTEESARRAVAHFEDELQVYRAIIGDDEGVASAMSNIAAAKSMYEMPNCATQV